MRTVSPGFGGVIIGAAMVVSLAYAMGDGSALSDLLSGLAAQLVTLISDGLHQAAQMVAALTG